jgi:hypothetical protein
MEATPRKFSPQFILAGDIGLDQQFPDDGMALLLHEVL